MITIGKITDGEVLFVWERMWERGRKELQRMGLAYAAMGEQYVKRNGTPFSFGIFSHKTPIAFMGATESASINGKKLYLTWFAATDEFEKVGAAATKALRVFLKQKTKEYPTAEIRLGTATDHPQADKWYRLLGFKPVGASETVRFYKYGGNDVSE